MESVRIKEILEKYYRGESSLDEEKELKRYFSENENIPSNLAYFKEIFSHFESGRKIQYPVSRKLFSGRLAFAASILIIMGISLVLGYYILNIKSPSNSVISYSNETSQIQKITLSDKNVVWLNKNSEITYPKKIKADDNKITVKGEVYFEIFNSENTYEIFAYNTLIKANITSSFNIRALEDMPSTEVTVDTGAVRIFEGHDPNSLALLIKAGYYCSVHKSQKLAFSSEIRNRNYKSWKTGELKFDNVPIATVASVLSEYFHVQIELENRQIAYCEFSGTFKKEPLDYILNNIQSQLNLKITNTGDVITLSGEKCF